MRVKAVVKTAFSMPALPPSLSFTAIQLLRVAVSQRQPDTDLKSWIHEINKPRTKQVEYQCSAREVWRASALVTFQTGWRLAAAA